LNSLSLTDLDMRLSAAKVTVGSSKLGRTAFGANLRGGALALSVGEAQMYGGIAKGSFGIARTDAVADVKAQFQFTDVDLQACASELFGNRLPEIIVEPGRSLVGDAGLIQSEVILISDKGDGEGKRWVYLDVGKFNGLAETMGESIRYRIQVPGRSGPSGPVIIAGPTCDSADILYERTEYRLPLDLAVGDKVEILSTGAYTASYASVGFNGFPPLRTYCL